MAKKQLIIIPGLGDRGRAYTLFLLVWKFFGFDTYIYVFGWNQATADFGKKLQAMLAYLDDFEDKEVNIIGVSAGGVAAVHALMQRPQAVKKVVTVSAPLTDLGSHDNQLLHTAMQAVMRELPGQPQAVKDKLLSVHGARDSMVAIRHSQPKGIRHKKLWLAGHSLVIFGAMTFWSGAIRKFLNSR